MRTLKNFLFVFITLTLLSFSSYKLNKRTIVHKASDLVLIHSVKNIKKHPSYEKVSNLSDEDLKDACNNPINGDYVTVKEGTKKV